MQVSVLSKTASRLTKSSQLSKNTRFRSYSSHPPVGDEDPISGEREIYNDGKRVYSRQEVAQHNTPSDAWIIINSKVYNISSWIEFHPGGEKVLLENMGLDATHCFQEIGHSHRAKAILDSLHIGHVKEKGRYTGL
jgi:cytochrome b involved in lipid metabolism